jgi:hypothetical protein
LFASGYGNLPSWAGDSPEAYLRAADLYERSNGSACREIVVALPKELTLEQNVALVRKIVAHCAAGKPHCFAGHCSGGAIGQVENPHAHILVGDRTLDGIERPKEQYFRRYNARDPAAGGCRKDSGGKLPQQMGCELRQLRADVAGIINAELTAAGLSGRVDHRSNRERGLDEPNERYRGRLAIKRMKAEELTELRNARTNTSAAISAND